MNRRRAAAPIAEGGDKIGVGAESPTSIPLGGSGASDLTVEAALEAWRQSAPQLAELTDGELLGAALLLAELDEVSS